MLVTSLPAIRFGLNWCGFEFCFKPDLSSMVSGPLKKTRNCGFPPRRIPLGGSSRRIPGGIPRGIHRRELLQPGVVGSPGGVDPPLATTMFLVSSPPQQAMFSSPSHIRDIGESTVYCSLYCSLYSCSAPYSRPLGGVQRTRSNF